MQAVKVSEKRKKSYIELRVGKKGRVCGDVLTLGGVLRLSGVVVGDHFTELLEFLV